MGPWLREVRQRSELDGWLSGSSFSGALSVALVIRGDGPVVRELLPNALDAAKQGPGRVVVWLKDPDLLSDTEVERLFAGNPSILGVVISAAGATASWMTSDRISVADAAFAYAEAEQN